MAVASNGVDVTVAATNGVTSQAFVVAVGGTLLTGNACMLAAFGIISPNATPILVNSVTDSVGNTWTKVTEQATGSGWSTPAINSGTQKGSTLSVWMTNNATINTSITITANFSGTTDVCVGGFSSKFTGVDAINPLDLNASLPAVGRTTVSANNNIAGISTNKANIYPLSFLSCFSNAILGTNMNYNGVFRNDTANTQQNGTEFIKVTVAQGPVVSSAYSSVSYTSSSSNSNSWHIGLALTSDSQVNLLAKSRTAIIG